MAANEIIGLIGSLGFPIAFIVAIMSFIERKLFPALVKYIDAQNEASAQRHAAFIAEIKTTREAIETTAKMLIIIEQAMRANYGDVSARLERMERYMATSDEVKA